MLSFVQSWFDASANPVGVDFGAHTLRMAQVDRSGADCRLIAAASAEAPAELADDPKGRLKFFTTCLRELWPKGNFRGRRVILALPAAAMHIQHLRLPRMDEASLAKAIPWELEGKLPIDPKNALIRHVVAGDIHHEQQPAHEVIVMAAEKDAVERLLAAAVDARLDVVGLSIEPRATIDCFQNIYRRQSDAAITNLFVDMGATGTRATIARGGRILFARAIAIGGNHLNQAVCEAMGVSLAECRAVREKQAGEEHDAIAAPAAMTKAMGQTGTATLPRVGMTLTIEQAILPAVERLAEELQLCCRYHDSTFPEHPAQRIIFVGGEAHQRDLCTTIARRLGIAAQMGDPMIRMARTTEVGIESGIDRRRPQPAWTVAMGLSMGAPGGGPANGMSL